MYHGATAEQAYALSDLMWNVFCEHQIENTNRTGLDRIRRGLDPYVDVFDVDKHPVNPETPLKWWNLKSQEEEETNVQKI